MDARLSKKHTSLFAFGALLAPRTIIIITIQLDRPIPTNTRVMGKRRYALSLIRKDIQ